MLPIELLLLLPRDLQDIHGIATSQCDVRFERHGWTSLGGGRTMITHIHSLKNHLAALVRDEEGASMVEYGLLVALIAIVAVTLLGTNLSTKLNSAATTLGS